MNITRVLAGTLVGGIVMFFLGWLIFGVFLMDFMKTNMIQYSGLMKEPMPDMIPLVIANLAFAWLIAFVFDYWAGIRDFVSGLKGGAFIGFPIAVWIDLQFFAFMNLYKGITPIIVDVLAATALSAIVGGVIGFVMGKIGNKPDLE